jgi:dCTP deaminase
MSVIALAAYGDNPSVVTSNEAFSRTGSAILILNADLEQLQVNHPDCNASYDLRVGGIFRDHRNRDGQALGPEQEISLLPGNAVIIETEEWVEFPRWRFGQILPRVSLLEQGIANTPSKIDSGYKGRLLITAFNHGKRTISLRRGQKFCSLHIFDVEGPVKPYDKPGKRISGQVGSAGWWRAVRDWIDANVPTVVVVQTVATLFALGIAALSYFGPR